MNGFGRIAAALALLVGSLSAFAQEPTPVPEPDATAQQIELLKQQVEALAAQVKALEQQQAAAAAEQTAVKEAQAKKAPAAIVTAGQDGFTIASPDKAFTMKVSGRIQFDTSWFSEDNDLKYSVGDQQDAFGFNSARLRLNGKLFDNIEYMMEYEFATQNGADNAEFKDVYLQLNDIPYGRDLAGNVTVGHFREPFSFEQLTSARYIMFVQRSLMDSLVPSRNPGIQWSDAILGEEKKERMTYALGVFKEADNWPSSNDADEDQGYSFTGRVTGLPYYANEGRQLLHLGFGYSHRNPDGAVVAYSARPENKLSQFRYVNVDATPLYRLRDARADDIDLYNLELASVLGPFSLQSEYTLSEVDTTFDNTRQFSGYYAQMGYFLTGEHRPYKNSAGVFDKVKPANNFGWGAEDGWGAWEVAARYSSLDFSDGGVRGGEQEDVTLGLSWYLNANTRVMWNYIHGEVDQDLYSGDFDAFDMRFQLEF
ncbi:MAG: porin [FCB group bacterium]|nr:porin [FCB group bacterium]